MSEPPATTPEVPVDENGLPETLGISRPSDTMDEKRYVELIEGVVRGTIAPKAAAIELDKIVQESNDKAYGRDFERIHFKYIDHTDERELASDASTWQTCLWYSIGRASSVIPANHGGQELLIQFLEELVCLPKHTIAYFTLSDVEMFEELWTLNGEDGYRLFPECLTVVHNDLLDFRRIDDKDQSRVDQKARAAFINFTTFSARLVGAHLVNVLILSPLTSKIFWDEHQSVTPEYTSAVLAAAQWILHAAADMLEMCLRNAQDGPFTYSMEHWARWRIIFLDITAHDSGFIPEARRAASESLEIMTEAELDAERDEYEDEPSIIDAFELETIDDYTHQEDVLEAVEALRGLEV